MFTDLFGKTRLKVNLHTHTTQSDGAKTPSEAAGHYLEQDYDILAITDHWVYTPSGQLDGMRILSGIEVNLGGNDGAGGVFHVVGLGCRQDPAIKKGTSLQESIDRIHTAGGLAVLAHPAWSLNRVNQLLGISGIDATEIFNAVSDAGQSARPYSGHFADACGCEGLLLPLLAVDDAHYYEGHDDRRGWIMLEGSMEDSDEDILDAIRQGRFYATEGPEIHLQVENGKAVVDCSAASSIRFFSNLTWERGHRHDGTHLTHAECELKPEELFIRAEVVDDAGHTAWSCPIPLK